MVKRWRRRSIHHKLDALEAGGARCDLVREVGSLRTVVLSDMHRGAGGDASDDFRGSAETYIRALDYYFNEGYDLVALGDCEELWEAPWIPIRDAYPEVYAQERRFLDAERYIRVYGNHDLNWQTEALVAAGLHDALPGVRVHEAAFLSVTDGGSALGTIVLVHGHQGTILSDYFSSFARLAVRHLWSNIQRWTHAAQPTPSTNYELLRTHDVAMRDWAAARANTILISGHTHRAIFSAPEVDRWLEAAVAEANAQGDAARGGELFDVTKKVAGLRPRNLPGEPVIEKPCYFNAGCCIARKDRRLDAIELADGQIRLVKWAEGDAAPRRARHRTADLRAVLGACG